MANYVKVAAPALAVIAGFALAACSSEAPASSTPAAPSASAAPAQSAPECAVSLPEGDSIRTVSFEGADYDVSVYAPQGLEAGSALVLDLHGSSSNGPLQAQVSGLSAVADSGGFIVAEPTGVVEVESYAPLEDGSWAWNVPGVPTTDGDLPPEDARDDVAFLNAVVAELSESGCVDSGKVFATGYSGGGRMASALACESADVFAAVAPVDGLRGGRADADDLTAVDPDTCAPSQPVSVLTFHGTADVVNPFDGNEDPRWGYSVPLAAETWAGLNGCDSAANVDTDEAVTTTTYAGCDGDTEVTAYFIEGANHIWPGTAADQSFFGETDYGVNASQVMWDFFESHARTSVA